eukprot:TRINITY_DN26356_c0_g1_i3.p1 TRINITY_DN26356_c0_g1~~TRINITY_DN26356_c0_g1_i3.p1  ORF type:complete len:199 (+),score=33.94 TRINITY_DN26356_c0_g1_i3:119-715(+)
MAKNIMITGQPGIGKSTLIKKVLDKLGDTYDVKSIAKGFFTAEIRGPQGRLGFDIITLDGRTGPLARLGSGGPGQPTVGRYAVDLQSFEALALPEITPSDEVKLYIVDEIGKMEFNSRLFFPMVRQLLNNEDALVLGTIPQARQGRQLREVAEVVGREDVVVVTLNRGNRDAWAVEVERAINQALQSDDLFVNLADMG